MSRETYDAAKSAGSDINWREYLARPVGLVETLEKVISGLNDADNRLYMPSIRSDEPDSRKLDLVVDIPRISEEQSSVLQEMLGVMLQSHGREDGGKTKDFIDKHRDTVDGYTFDGLITAQTERGESGSNGLVTRLRLPAELEESFRDTPMAEAVAGYRKALDPSGWQPHFEGGDAVGFTGKVMLQMADKQERTYVTNSTPELIEAGMANGDDIYEDKNLLHMTHAFHNKGQYLPNRALDDVPLQTNDSSEANPQNIRADKLVISSSVLQALQKSEGLRRDITGPHLHS